VECKPCEKELPLLAEKEKQYENVIFAAIHAELNQATDSNYNIEDIQLYGKSLKDHPKRLILGSERLKMQFGIKGFPATVLLNVDNNVEKIIYGFNASTVKQLNAWLEQQ
jgi:thiol-disulfide isomerase/thioredoxin